MIKRLGVLTSGGDCAGLNAVLRAITLRAIQGYKWQVYGIHRGTLGLLQRPLSYQELTLQTFDGFLLRQGGTFLRSTNRGDPNAYPMEDGTFKDRSDEFLAGCRELGLDGLISIGGDGSLKIIRKLVQKAHLPFIAIPKTIDNDLGITERSIGFSSAVEVATEALDRLHPTAASHDRVMLLEVMGRDAGHIALTAGIAGGADIVLIPEIPYKITYIINKINEILNRGRTHVLIVVAEAVKTLDDELLQILDTEGRGRYGGIAHYLSNKITQLAKVETRFSVLGHVQRGSEPNAEDRWLASAFGVKAVDLMASGQTDRMVGWQNQTVIDMPVLEATNINRVVHPDDVLVHTARALGICLGDA